MIQTEKNSRRKFIKQGVLAAAGTAGLLSINWNVGDSHPLEVLNESYPEDGVFKPDPLPYNYDALEPFIDARTMEVHYTRHYQGYIDKLNAAMEKVPEYKGKPIEFLLSNIDGLPEGSRQPIRNQGGGYLNHSLFWKFLTPNKETKPSAKLSEAINAAFDSREAFIESFKTAGLGLFGSGWVWLTKSSEGKLTISTTANQDNPILDPKKGTPILGIDVWEHAYYLKHLNKRADYLTDIWNVINWEKVSELFEK